MIFPPQGYKNISYKWLNQGMIFRPHGSYSVLYMCLGTKTKVTSIFCISPILLVFIGTCPTSLSVFPRKSNSSSTTESTLFWTVSQVTNVLYWMSKNSMGLYVTSPLSTPRAVRGVLRLKGSLDNQSVFLPYSCPLVSAIDLWMFVLRLSEAQTLPCWG